MTATWTTIEPRGRSGRTSRITSQLLWRGPTSVGTTLWDQLLCERACCSRVVFSSFHTPSSRKRTDKSERLTLGDVTPSATMTEEETITVKFLQGFKGSVTCRAAATLEELVAALCTTASLEKPAVASFIVRGRCPVVN